MILLPDLSGQELTARWLLLLRGNLLGMRWSVNDTVLVIIQLAITVRILGR
jgi:hypothetical protein